MTYTVSHYIDGQAVTATCIDKQAIYLSPFKF